MGATAWQFVLGIRDVTVTDPTEDALDQAGHTIDLEVCPRTPPNGIISFGESRLVPFQGPTPTIREPQRTLNPAGGYTPHLSVDYSCDVQRLRQQHARNLYEEEGKDLRIEYRFWHPFHFDFYNHLVYRRFLHSKKGEPPVLDMQYINTYKLGKMPELELK